jgi:PAS domain S-box-containing protein
MRYFFHFLVDDDRLDDDLGLAYASAAEAKADALRAAREMIADLIHRDDGTPPDGCIEITDERGRLVDSVPLFEAAFGAAPESRYRRIFEAAPQGTLLLAPDLTIVEANRAYLRATMTERAGIVGRPLFDVFPDNPDDPDASGVRNLAASLDAVLREKAQHVMPVQRYDVRRPDGGWDVRYWKPTNFPVLDGGGEVELIVHQVEDVTRAVMQEASAVG